MVRTEILLIESHNITPSDMASRGIFLDEMVCDIVPMDYIDVLVGIPFLHDRKDTIIPYQGKCIVSMDDKSNGIHVIPSPIATSLLVNKA